MPRIVMKATNGSTVEELFQPFLSAAAARGVRVKTLETYQQQLKSISKRLKVTIPISELSKLIRSYY